MGTEISGIVKGILQVKAGLKAGSQGKEPEQDFSAGFMELMNQNSLPNMSAAADSGKMQFYTDAANSKHDAHDTYSGPVKTVSVQKTSTSKDVQTESGDSLQAYEEEIRSVLKEELGVTDEEITAAMEALGMNILDVRNLQDLAALVQELTGEDIGTLFASEAFQNVMKQTAAVTEALCAELGVTGEEWNAMCENLKQTGQTEYPDMEPTVDLKGSQTEEPVNFADGNSLSEENPLHDALLKEQAEMSASKREETAVTVERGQSLGEAESTEGIPAEFKKEAETFSGEEQNLMDHSGDKGDMTHTGAVFANQQAVRTEEFILPQETLQPYGSQVDAFDLIDQIAKNVRVTISAAETSMEMQLNPENLGKIYLNVSEREGVIRAQITAQNTAVKEALELQIVELRQSLSQQGVKVDAIEVTVGTHEFEQNLEENARGEEQAKQQMQESGKGTRRNLNLNDLDGLSGLMSEEEQLAAQIMKDNGNQVDFTA